MRGMNSTSAYFFIFLVIFLGNNPDLLFFEDLISPFLLTGARRLSLAGQPLFWLQAGAATATENRNAQQKRKKRYFFMNFSMFK